MKSKLSVAALAAALAALLSAAPPAVADDADKIARLASDAHRLLALDELEWFDDPTLPAGAQVSIVAGDPGAAGVFIAYVKLPADYVIPPHSHPFAEVVTVLTGEVGNGFGDAFDRDAGQILGAGSTFVLPAGHTHYLWNDEEVVALLVATGPWNITYVNPEDDPRSN